MHQADGEGDEEQQQGHETGFHIALADGIIADDAGIGGEATDFGILLGSFGIFFSLVLIFARVLPVIATTEVKAILPGAQAGHGGAHD